MFHYNLTKKGIEIANNYKAFSETLLSYYKHGGQCLNDDKDIRTDLGKIAKLCYLIQQDCKSEVSEPMMHVLLGSAKLEMYQVVSTGYINQVRINDTKKITP